MVAFYTLAGYALCFLAFACIIHGVPSLVSIEKHYYYDSEEGDEPKTGTKAEE